MKSKEKMTRGADRMTRREGGEEGGKSKWKGEDVKGGERKRGERSIFTRYASLMSANFSAAVGSPCCDLRARWQGGRSRERRYEV
eukprot:746285-Hanusia_phi.AAC.4